MLLYQDDNYFVYIFWHAQIFVFPIAELPPGKKLYVSTGNIRSLVMQKINQQIFF